MRRRELLARGGLGAAVVLFGTGLRVPETAYGQGAEMATDRVAVFSAVVDALGKSKSSLVDGAKADEVVSGLRNDYRSGDDAFRANIDGILDAVEPPTRRGSFARKDSSARLTELRERRRNSAAVKWGQSDSFFINSAIAIASVRFVPPETRMQMYEIPA